MGPKALRRAVETCAAARHVKAPFRFVEVESGWKYHRPELANAPDLAKIKGATLVIARNDRLARDATFLLTLGESGVRHLACDKLEANGLNVGLTALVALQEREAIA